MGSLNLTAAKRRKAEAQGRFAEAAVASLWAEKGFTVLAQRLRTGAGELDLIVADPRTLIFIEVKARSSLAEAAYAIPARDQARLLGAADAALALHPDWARPDTRFDVALVAHGTVQHIEDAIRYH